MAPRQQNGQVAVAIDHALSLARVYENRLRPMHLNLTGDSVGDDHVVGLANHDRRKGDEPLASKDNRCVGTKASNVDTEHGRRKGKIALCVVSSNSRPDIVDADERVVCRRIEVAKELLAKFVLAHLSTQAFKFLRRNHARLFDAIKHGLPIRIALAFEFQCLFVG